MHRQTEQHFFEHGAFYKINNQALGQFVTTRLARQVGNLVSALLDEIEASTPGAWGKDGAEFRGFGVYDALRVVIADPDVVFASNMPPCGTPSQQVEPKIRRDLVSRGRPESERCSKEWEDDDRHPEGKQMQTNNDFLQWLIQQGEETGDPYMWDYKRLQDYCGAPASNLVGLDKPEYIEELRQEISSVLGEHGGQWDKRALAQMQKLDSFFCESQQVNSVLTIGPLRRVNAKGGVATPTGVDIPKGYQVRTPAFETHFDTDIWGIGALEIHPFQFTEKRLDADGDRVQRPRHAWVTASSECLSFGGERNVCPRRFFASAELKVMPEYTTMLNYDFVVHHDRPRNIWLATNPLPPTEAIIKVRRRHKAN
ncbi:hypothetical protein Daus18300_002719 [Diaporthe australafricana]|uniref:Cytochrome P450 n=1 Tax=Diaporthe australafricana TaxID=127596 RepID=A0ABR3XKI8_9PEZI